jgi:hypothetical protein
MFRSSLVTVTALLGFAGASHAQTPFFGDDNPRGTFTNSFAARNAFLAALSSSGTDNIESYAPFTPDPTLTFGGTGITATTDVDFVAPEPTLAVSGTQFLVDRGDGPDVFTLSTAVTGFGLFVVQAGDAANQTTITMRLENTVLNTTKDITIGTFGPGRDFDSVFFFGIIDSAPFNRVSLLETPSDAGDGTLYDDITVGFAAAVPEPASLALLGLAAGGALAGGKFMRRSRRRKVIAR